MPQAQLPLFPEGVEHITSELAVQKADGRVTYFNGSMPIFSHDEKDLASFRMITSQFCAQGTCRQVDIQRVFGVTAVSMKRQVKRYREAGPKAFFREPARRGAPVMTPAVGTRGAAADNGRPPDGAGCDGLSLGHAASGSADVCPMVPRKFSEVHA